tara:strand:- start:623 stop:2188 length:1566 start_codon:yes stop_codon:yes gene_type:complete
MLEKYLNNRLFTLFLFPFLIGSLTVFSFQPYNLTIINFLILPSFFYLIIFIKKKSKNVYRKKPYRKNLFLCGTSFGFGFFLCGIYWITNSLTFDESFRFLIPFGLILVPLFLSLFFSIVSVLIGPFLNLNLNSLLLFSAGLSLSDYFRAKILTGFPWNLWAYSYSWSGEILQILNNIGLFAFNLILITLFMLPAITFSKYKLMQKTAILSVIPIILLILFIYGSYSKNQNDKFLDTLDKKIYVKVVSPNFDLKYGLDNKEIESRLKKLIKYSEPEKKIKTIFIWPEGVFSGYNFDQLSKLKNIFKKNFSKDHYILFGVNTLDPGTGGIFNSLVIVNNSMEILHKYNKQKLVPFGEFLPFETLLNKIGLKKITEGHGSFLKAEKQKNILFDNLNILTLICYEIIFTKLAQDSNYETNLIINISEDGWFGKSIGPHQHFSKAIFRAIEQNSFLLRSANKGISAIINNKGAVIKKLEPNEAGNIDFYVSLVKTNNKNKNDLIFFVLLFTYILLINIYNKNNEKK